MMRDDGLGLPPWADWALQQTGRPMRLRVDGVGLHLLSWAADGDDKPPLLLVHGHRAHAHWWDFIAPFLTARHRVFAMDLSGMGDSERRTAYPAGTAARDIAGVLRALGLGPTTVIGHSNGGLRALQGFSYAPELFARIIAIDSYAVFEGNDHPSEPAGLKGDRLYPDLASALARYRLLPEQARIEPWAFDHVARHSLREVDAGWRWKFDPLMPSGMEPGEDWPAILAAVRCPVHYVYGGESAIVNARLAQRIVAALPDGHGPVVIPGGFHHLMFDQPTALISTLQALLA